MTDETQADGRHVIEYTPPGSLKGFLRSDKFVSLVTGPVGSGKSSAAMLKIAYHAAKMRPQRDGIRRSRAVIVRNTAEMLRDSTFPTFTTWFPDGVAGIYQKTNKQFLLSFGDVECLCMFRGLDDADDVRRLLSLEVSFGILDEFREIHPDIYNALQGRVGRYPSKANGGCVDDQGNPNYHVWGASNAPDADTFWEDILTNPPSTVGVFMQPSARSAECDWKDNLVDGYYETLAEGKEERWIRVYIDNKFGESLSGKPVFSSFNTETHVAKVPLTVLASPVIIGVDAGLSPAAIFGQVDYSGRLVVHDSLTGSADGMGAFRFIRERIKPLVATKFPGRSVLVVIDPAAFQRGQADEKTVADMFKVEGFKVIPARTNAVSARLASVDSYLNRQVNGVSAITFDPEGCGTLIQALRSKYRYKTNTKGETDDKPEKSHPWSDVSDGLQYLCMHADNGAAFGAQMNSARRNVKQVSVGAWT